MAAGNTSACRPSVRPSLFAPAISESNHSHWRTCGCCTGLPYPSLFSPAMYWLTIAEQSWHSETFFQIQKTFKPKYNMDDLKTDGSQFSKLFKDGEVFKIGNIAVEVLHTPGHTPSCLTYYLKDDAVFTGDTLFMPDMGSAR